MQWRRTYSDDSGVIVEYIQRLDGRIALGECVHVPGILGVSTAGQWRVARDPCQWHTVLSSDAPRIWPFLFGFHASPNLCIRRQPRHALPTTEAINSPFLSLPYEPDVRLTHPAALRLARVLRPVEHEHVARDGLSRDQVRVLRHVARAVDLARMVDALHDADARLCRRERVPAELAALLVVRAAVEDVRACAAAGGDLHRCDLQVVRCLAGRVRAEK
jgi:hypothetical protein